eukprot:jgi/Psemu1/43363/gm1.43363_g
MLTDFPIIITGAIFTHTYIGNDVFDAIMFLCILIPTTCDIFTITCANDIFTIIGLEDPIIVTGDSNGIMFTSFPDMITCPIIHSTECRQKCEFWSVDLETHYESADGGLEGIAFYKKLDGIIKAYSYDPLNHICDGNESDKTCQTVNTYGPRAKAFNQQVIMSPMALITNSVPTCITLCKTNNNPNLETENATFEPSDFCKGKTARMMLYMDI